MLAMEIIGITPKYLPITPQEINKHFSDLFLRKPDNAHTRYLIEEEKKYLRYRIISEDRAEEVVKGYLTLFEVSS